MNTVTKKIIVGILLAAITVSGGVGIYFITRDQGGEDTEIVTSTVASDWVENYNFDETTNSESNMYENHTLPAVTVN